MNNLIGFYETFFEIDKRLKREKQLKNKNAVKPRSN